MKFRLIIPFCMLAFLFGCGQAAKPQDPIAVVRAQIDALNRGKADLSTSYFSEDAIIVAPLGQPKGKVKIRAFMLNAIKIKVNHEIIGLTADGSTVTGTVMAKGGGLANPVLMNLKAIVLNGKITDWEIGTKAQ